MCQWPSERQQFERVCLAFENTQGLMPCHRLVGEIGRDASPREHGEPAHQGSGSLRCSRSMPRRVGSLPPPELLRRYRWFSMAGAVEILAIDRRLEFARWGGPPVSVRCPGLAVPYRCSSVRNDNSTILSSNWSAGRPVKLYMTSSFA